ncbi:carbohydrate ABC transporter permease [Lachnoclostridium sp. Marseille-P6806]|uniref:carbohydrate ABC transporter permease n=1 Tax=Lachnoclostridium sp. Marseille-P6806 TaxID=2364793 RepID=UPI001F5EF0AC|nr:carbohydrate ABC transporter permease [Lachnoclostridium sp. Marseille-P6806]
MVTAACMLLTIACASLLGFIIVRRDTRGCRIFYRIITLGIIAPFAALPTIRILKIMSLYGTRVGLCLVTTALNIPYTTMIISSYLKSIPRELDEAAVIDGTSGMTLFRRIIFPLLKPVLAAGLVVNFMWTWNAVEVPVYLLNSSYKWTLPLSIYNFVGQYSSYWNLVCADIVLLSIPVILLYVFCQKLMIGGMISGAVKA